MRSTVTMSPGAEPKPEQRARIDESRAEAKAKRAEERAKKETKEDDEAKAKAAGSLASGNVSGAGVSFDVPSDFKKVERKLK